MDFSDKTHKEALKLIGEVGLLAAYRGDLSEAKLISEAIENANPLFFLSHLIRAIVELQEGKLEDALDVLESQLAVPESADFSRKFMYLFILCARGKDGLFEYRHTIERFFAQSPTGLKELSAALAGHSA